jgi:hypothetical protein
VPEPLDDANDERQPCAACEDEEDAGDVEDVELLRPRRRRLVEFTAFSA